MSVIVDGDDAAAEADSRASDALGGSTGQDQGQSLLSVIVDVDDAAAEADSLAKAADDIGYDDISDDELDDLIEGAESEQDDKPTESIGRDYLASCMCQGRSVAEWLACWTQA